MLVLGAVGAYGMGVERWAQYTPDKKQQFTLLYLSQLLERRGPYER